MKRIIYTSILMLFAIICHSQSTPESFLGLLPSVPRVECNRDASQQQEAMMAFQNQITDVQERLDVAIRREKEKSKTQKLSGNVKQKAVDKSGLSEQELGALSNDKTSKGKKDQMINKSVQSQTGFSMEEMQKVKNMSKADRQKWAMENYGKAMQSEKQNSEGSLSSQSKSGSMAELAQEQQSIAQNLQHHYSRIKGIKEELEAITEKEQILLDKKIEEINKKYKDVNDGEGANAQDVEKLRQKREMIRKAKTNFCGNLTPLNLNYLNVYLNTLKENILPDLKRQEEIEYQISKQTFTQAEMSSFQRLRAIQDYAGALSQAYRFYQSVDKY